MTPLHLVVLAAGKGTRMRSRKPKVLQPLAGRPLLAHVLDRAAALDAAACHLVVSHQQERVRAAFAESTLPLDWIDQGEPRGTGHAVFRALEHVPEAARVLVTYGDVPRIPVADLEACAAGDGVTVLAARVADPGGYGRLILAPDGALERIVEDKEASIDERAVDLINTGVLAAPAGDLRRWLAACEPAPGGAREWYLTDVVAAARADGSAVTVAESRDPAAVLGVNDRAQLAVQERLYQQAQAADMMRDGLALADPDRVDVRGVLTFGQDCTLDVNVVIEGTVTLADDVYIGPGCVLRDSQIGSGTQIAAHSILEGVRVDADARIGPFARLRPGTVLGTGARVGNFVEMKNATLGPGAKANHLTYVGDARVGAGANLGAGTITCNYDGANKHHTEIGERAFIGSNTALVAPIRIGDDATVGAGSTLSDDVEPGALALTRARPRTIRDWPRPKKTSKNKES
ncbi:MULTISPECIES: bifunctional UDP-N-acetylglucosamine diphosphorylase/glucosamine-1-phosphate N-acetyltransferase GlmU [unclassified Thioalkalivibrio]|uniref:bifunctional UDP-N-acetylglucosamine diphosphorylase/glucosamine-1-phosphate N-acetyltransferase GlmU n=1 Tax=unclassified Thioalkalivibrio TaxID=2621013 RepID=UPI000380008D|nr:MULTISPECIES: bifunctional UDP-N-acetylglucosamine diphosphorylase/glucosamine-1-phosphate N-acetyltransferase GlmU [unclassified Thioalkalivibrio]